MNKTLFLGCLLFSLQSKSQSTVSPVSTSTFNLGGGSAILTPHFVVDWSIGESTITETFFGQSFNVTSGVLQPFDNTHIIFNPLITSWTTEEIRMYPVPTSGNVFIDFRSITTGKISIELMSAEGRPLETREFSQVNAKGVQSWDLANRASGVYYFRILLSGNQGQVLKQGVFKIEKIK